MTSGRLPRRRGRAALVAVVAAALPVALLVGGCGRSVDGEPHARPTEDALRGPEDLEALIVTEVPSGLPRLADDELDPPAGPKRVEDVAEYADDPAREREVLQEFGYRYGWERFWGAGAGPVTGVFVDLFETRAGAGAYVEDLARNEAEQYSGMLWEDPPGLPGNCRLLTVDEAAPDSDLSGPAAFAWCGHGDFSVSVTSIADSIGAAEQEVRLVLEEQLGLLPRR
ncbi:hypothetical protein [Blastococcus sp. PRF04-17]|uniref:hypothetical protein n=1 Tax=Blastococcus sp. PRF04-17 TaxID=2933797 RepID=UPI001FF46C66|nr:hypothetical protein [Blastococcus sp. PRF04-17]UOY01490.1 hypothetical protein MVA48_21575 [Blastococcus sp. PRF04-17]